MSKWIALFMNPELGNDDPTPTDYLLPALSTLKAATKAGLMVRILSPNSEGECCTEHLADWLAKKGVPGVVATNEIDSNCAMIIGPEVFRVDPENNKFCHACQIDLTGRRLACLGVSWPRVGGGFVEFL